MTSTLPMQAFVGPSDTGLPRSEIEGYQPVSRIGEVVINSFIDSQEYIRLQADGGAENQPGHMPEPVPHYHEWAAVLPGMVCLMRKRRHESFQNRVAAETAVPVISCVACQGTDQSANKEDWLFAGVARSKSVPPIDDGNGPSHDEYFTLTIGGMAVVLNTSQDHIFPGDYVEWAFCTDDVAVNNNYRNVRKGPRRVGVKPTPVPTRNTFAKAQSHASPKEPLDVLIYQC